MTERFELLQELGRGGMGVVWKARDDDTGEIMALKLLHSSYADDPDYVARFEREVEVAKKVDSPNVVKVLGFGLRDRVPFVAMEYIGGRSLRQHLKDAGPLKSWDDVKPIAIGLTKALEAVHAAGVIHRDVKPSNVLLDADGTVKLVDFGIARAADLTRMTGSVTTLGTPAYMAPDSEASAQSDLYGLGCVLFELMTGAPPFEGDSQQQVFVRHIREDPDLDQLPARARRIVGWLLEKEPARRPPSAAEFLAVLQGTSSVPQPRPSPDAQPKPIPQRRPALVRWGLPAGLAVAGIGLAATVALVGLTSDDPQPAWTMIPNEVVAYTPRENEVQPLVKVGPVVYGPDFAVVSFKVTPKCPPGQAEINWAHDAGTANVRLRARDGARTLSSAGWGLGTADATLACGTEYIGTWMFDLEEDLPDPVLEYTGPAFELPLPARRAGTQAPALTLDLPREFRVGQQVTVGATTCLPTLAAPAFASPAAHCFAPREVLQILSGPIDNLFRWWEVRADDGTTGWIDQASALAAVER